LDFWERKNDSEWPEFMGSNFDSYTLRRQASVGSNVSDFSDTSDSFIWRTISEPRPFFEEEEEEEEEYVLSSRLDTPRIEELALLYLPLDFEMGESTDAWNERYEYHGEKMEDPGPPPMGLSDTKPDSNSSGSTEIDTETTTMATTSVSKQAKKKSKKKLFREGATDSSTLIPVQDQCKNFYYEALNALLDVIFEECQDSINKIGWNSFSFWPCESVWYRLPDMSDGLFYIQLLYGKHPKTPSYRTIASGDELLNHLFDIMGSGLRIETNMQARSKANAPLDRYKVKWFVHLDVPAREVNERLKDITPDQVRSLVDYPNSIVSKITEEEERKQQEQEKMRETQTHFSQETFPDLPPSNDTDSAPKQPDTQQTRTVWGTSIPERNSTHGEINEEELSMSNNGESHTPVVGSTTFESSSVPQASEAKEETGYVLTLDAKLKEKSRLRDVPGEFRDFYREAMWVLFDIFIERLESIDTSDASSSFTVCPSVDIWTKREFGMTPYIQFLFGKNKRRNKYPREPESADRIMNRLMWCFGIPLSITTSLPDFRYVDNDTRTDWNFVEWTVRVDGSAERVAELLRQLTEKHIEIAVSGTKMMLKSLRDNEWLEAKKKSKKGNK
jgi:hypothetical protein